MTQEEKQLLIKDLSARLPYGVKVNHFGIIKELLGVVPSSENVMVGYDINNYEDSVIEDIKPYLRSISSMTNEEWNIFDSLTTEPMQTELFDWLNEHHFDFRNLIEKGLAIDCTDLNIY